MEQHKYLKVAKALRAEIAAGKYPLHAKLPGEYALAKLYRVSRQTIRQALSILERDGFARRVQGSGTYVQNREPHREQSRNIAVITTYIGEYIFPTVLKGIEQTLTEHQYTSMLAATQNRAENERRILMDFLQKSVDGFIIEGTKTALPNPNIDLYRRIADTGIPMVFINGYYQELYQPMYVVTDDRQGGYDACKFLIEKGHRRIAGIFKSDDMQGHKRYAGTVAALLDSGIELCDENVLWFTTGDRDKILGGFALEAVRDCTAAVCYNDEVAVRLVELLRSVGQQVPRDMAVISFDNSTYSEIAAVKITSLNHPKERLGRLAAEKLLNMIRGVAEAPAIMPWGFEEREST